MSVFCGSVVCFLWLSVVSTRVRFKVLHCSQQDNRRLALPAIRVIGLHSSQPQKLLHPIQSLPSFLLMNILNFCF
uniref:Secreted protein n=1 Tax=Anguilla anguilla TaxID=7936 RepID=A0A0E9XDP7_ANGAN